MSMTETPNDATKLRNAKKRAATAKPAPPSEMVGLTATTCAAACSATRCIISGVGICAHPYKGGLQSSLQSPDAVARLKAASRVIGKRKLELATE